MVNNLKWLKQCKTYSPVISEGTNTEINQLEGNISTSAERPRTLCSKWVINAAEDRMRDVSSEKTQPQYLLPGSAVISVLCI